MWDLDDVECDEDEAPKISEEYGALQFRYCYNSGDR